jgi:hypothetical protein
MIRNIRLKEWGTYLNMERAPVAANFANADETLEPGPFRFRTDENGFISSGFETNPEDPAIVVLGDSVVECMFLHEGSRLTDKTELALRSRGAGFRVLNGGTTGSSTLHLLNSLVTKVLPLRPSAVVMMSGIMDLDCVTDAASFWTTNPYLTPLKLEPPPTEPRFSTATKRRTFPIGLGSCT